MTFRQLTQRREVLAEYLNARFTSYTQQQSDEATEWELSDDSWFPLIVHVAAAISGDASVTSTVSTESACFRVSVRSRSVSDEDSMAGWKTGEAR